MVPMRLRMVLAVQPEQQVRVEVGERDGGTVVQAREGRATPYVQTAHFIGR